MSKCVQQTANAAIKYASDTVKNTYDAIKQDPWKFVATAAVGILATVAVGALCATGVGCLILAGAVAGAMQAGAGYMVDVARGDAEFSWSGLADTMIQGGLDGALSAGVSKYTGGATKFVTKPFKAAAAGGMKKMLGGGGGTKEVTAPKRTSGEASGGGSRRTEERGSSRSDEGGGGSGKSCPRPHSFAPDTLVLLADGTTKPIKDVQVGDQVQTTDPTSGSTQGKKVEGLHRNQDTDLSEVTVRSKDGSDAVLHTTWFHPFWDDTQHSWIDAQDLKTGDALHTDDGAIVEVKSVRNTVGSADMRDLTVTDVHTYYVMAGDTPVLVHNCGGGLNRLIGSLRNKANDTYIGRLITGRPMEPWRSNRILSRQLAGEPAPANATVRDLVGMQNGNGAIGYKVADANGRSDEDLLASVFNPQDGQYIATSASRPNVIAQGNHRAMQLIARALDPLNDNINLDTEIFIHRVGQ